MIHVLEGGTDAASMLLFDPEALPDDFDDRARDDPSAAIEDAAAAGRLFRLETLADGRFGLGLCVGEDPPEDVRPFLRLVDEDERLVVNGRLIFAGVEYGFRRDDALLAKHPHMGSSCEVPAGTYRLRVFEAEYPDHFLAGRLQGVVSEAGLRLDALMGRLLLPLGSLGTIAGVVGLVGLGWDSWRVSVLPACLAMVLPAVVVSRLRTYREAVAARREAEREAPPYWAVLEPVATA